MNDSFRKATGRKLISRATAQEVGAVVVGNGRNAKLVDWSQIEMLLVGTREIPAGSLLGSGSYAIVFDADQDPTP